MLWWAISLCLSAWALSALGAEPLAETDGVECWLTREAQSRSKVVKEMATGFPIWLELSMKPSRVEARTCVVQWAVAAGERRFSFESMEREDMELRYALLALPVKGERLVARLERTAGDYAEDELVEVDLSQGILRRINLKAMRKQINRQRPKCQFNLTAMGVRNDGRVDVEAYPIEDLAPGESSCLPEKYWIFDPKSQKARPVK